MYLVNLRLENERSFLQDVYKEATFEGHFDYL